VAGWKEQEQGGADTAREGIRYHCMDGATVGAFTRRQVEFFRISLEGGPACLHFQSWSVNLSRSNCSVSCPLHLLESRRGPDHGESLPLHYLLVSLPRLGRSLGLQGYVESDCAKSRVCRVVECSTMVEIHCWCNRTDIRRVQYRDNFPGAMRLS
jgi:hypothetical protein